jgi:starch synthase
MYSLRYGHAPHRPRHRGLADSVVDVNAETLAERSANGFVLDGDTPHALWLALERACRAWHDKRLWRRIQQNGMRRDFSWSHAAAAYGALYRDALAIHV